MRSWAEPCPQQRALRDDNTYDDGNTRRALGDDGPTRPAIDEDLLEAYAAVLRRAGMDRGNRQSGNRHQQVRSVARKPKTRPQRAAVQTPKPVGAVRENRPTTNRPTATSRDPR